jgi:hypothetical protein
MAVDKDGATVTAIAGDVGDVVTAIDERPIDDGAECVLKHPI